MDEHAIARTELTQQRAATERAKRRMALQEVVGDLAALVVWLMLLIAARLQRTRR